MIKSKRELVKTQGTVHKNEIKQKNWLNNETICEKYLSGDIVNVNLYKVFSFMYICITCPLEITLLLT